MLVIVIKPEIPPEKVSPPASRSPRFFASINPGLERRVYHRLRSSVSPILGLNHRGFVHLDSFVSLIFGLNRRGKRSKVR